ncbi:class I SAM-dependent methyltransferase [Leptospira borgpetersenii]|uniref:class I SAM-dependent methyltransferase n=1 Tax=Leptospira borgpetersenii TaxID=174 RepID=UPI0021598D83|nr:class I SAM-dependent methyltransferase [Leptospira borgpetersenii]UVD72099.1 class I SAM-dependent methyltransferase [Leptospira borgpetersenii]UVD75283.1 class I SAM-dependent methyltransferase [Leptospira borgpetersenii]UZW31839.1 class I SAM-dependent methyltransferase [Leptospira borgpetersenii]
MIVEHTIVGLLQTNGSITNVEVCGHSRYSFQIRLPKAPPYIVPFNADGFIIELDGKRIELGRCRMLPVKHAATSTALPQYLVLFLDDTVDVVDLIGKKRFTVYDAGLFNLQLILNQKEKVNQRFKEYSANLTFELNVYKQFFDDLDRKFLKEPGPVQEHLHQMILEREGQTFMEFFESKVLELQEQTKNFSKDENEAHGFFFRKQVWDFILHSAFMLRTNLKPRGYAGNYEMMKMIYENEIMGKSLFARLLHSYPLQIPAANAVRNRRRMIADQIREAVENHDNSDFRAMSVACGPADEIGEAFSDMVELKKIHFTLLDQDMEALRVAMNTVNQLELEKGISIHVRYINDSVRSMLRIRDLPGAWGRFDFIYSMGLFDYLTPPVARAVLARLFEMLRPGGKLIVGNFHVSNPDKAFMEYWLDWVLYHRTEEEMLELASTFPGHSRIFFEKTGCQMFLEMRAPNG